MFPRGRPRYETVRLEAGTISWGASSENNTRNKDLGVRRAFSRRKFVKITRNTSMKRRVKCIHCRSRHVEQSRRARFSNARIPRTSVCRQQWRPILAVSVRRRATIIRTRGQYRDLECPMTKKRELYRHHAVMCLRLRWRAVAVKARKTINRTSSIK